MSLCTINGGFESTSFHYKADTLTSRLACYITDNALNIYACLTLRHDNYYTADSTGGDAIGSDEAVKDGMASGSEVVIRLEAQRSIDSDSGCSMQVNESFA